ncbi:hypothetical protein FA13DRAFT_768116 [Coprinellus micaceus]|uniref:Uncharacterized protein n=1 Tax=Coprinellus micaceus TaxID=71717 RepID=A0A4Y7S7P6_COPMI|nr:hypothetical protein FA13DRAFT_768116 [Coprinellus micaceus]
MGLTRLEELTIENFALPSTPYPERRGFLPIHIRRLTVVRTGGAELTFLLTRFDPVELQLEYCTFVSAFPGCTCLRLRGIPLRRDGLVDAMWGWDGLELEVTSSPAFDDDLVRGLESRMHTERRPVWPSMMRIRIQGCPYSDRLFGRMLDQRTQLLKRQGASSSRRS